MIRLDVEDYCQQCLDFCPDVISAERVSLGDKDFGLSDTIVRCEYRKRCAAIERYLRKQIKENER